MNAILSLAAIVQGGTGGFAQPSAIAALRMACRNNSLPVMTAPKYSKLKRLHKLLPEGLIADAAWFNSHGYPSSLRSNYVAAGWLENVAPGICRRPLFRAGFEGVPVELDWRQILVSSQLVMGYPLAVGGETALTLLGRAHYLPLGGFNRIDLHSDGPAPAWLTRIPGKVRFRIGDARRLFRNPRVRQALKELKEHLADGTLDWLLPLPSGYRFQAGGIRDWPLLLACPEQAIFEVMDRLPGDRTVFHGADMLMEGLYDLDHERVGELLRDCRSIKVKRLVLWFAERHEHPWLDEVDFADVDLGRGTLSFWKGGTFDPKYRVVMPVNELDAGG